MYSLNVGRIAVYTDCVGDLRLESNEQCSPLGDAPLPNLKKSIWQDGCIHRRRPNLDVGEFFA